MDPEDLIAQAKDRGITITLRPDGKISAPGLQNHADLDQAMRADPERMRQYLGRLQANPRYYSGFGGPATGVVARGIEGLINPFSWFQRTPTGGVAPRDIRTKNLGGIMPMKPRPTSSLSEWGAEKIVPQTPRQAGIDAAVIASMVPGAGPAMLPLMLAGGGIGGALEATPAGGISQISPKEALKQGGMGALDAASQWGMGKLLSKGPYRMPLPTRSTALDETIATNVGKTLRGELPDLQGVEGPGSPLNDPIDYSQEFQGGNALKRASQKMNDVHDTARTAVAQNTVTGRVPMQTLTTGRGTPQEFEFDDVVDRIRELDEAGKWHKADPRPKAEADAARAKAAFVKQEFRGRLNQVQPGLGNELTEANTQWAKTKTLTDVLSDPKIYPQKGGSGIPTEMGQKKGQWDLPHMKFKFQTPEEYGGNRGEMRRQFGDTITDRIISQLGGGGPISTKAAFPGEVKPPVGRESGGRWGLGGFRLPSLAKRPPGVTMGRRLPPIGGIPPQVSVLGGGQMTSEALRKLLGLTGIGQQQP